MPCDYSKYPKNWKTEIRPRIIKRAGNKCEFCGLPNYARGFRDEDGVFNHVIHARRAFTLKDGVRKEYKIIKIVLTISHQDHDTEHNDDNNLKALCQKCHLNHDKDHHRKTRSKNKHKNQLELGL